MRQVILQFNCILEMVEFQTITQTFYCEADTNKLLLMCTLSEADIELAKSGYDAKLLDLSSLN